MCLCLFKYKVITQSNHRDKEVFHRDDCQAFTVETKLKFLLATVDTIVETDTPLYDVLEVLVRTTCTGALYKLQYTMILISAVDRQILPIEAVQ